jgi:hypothetical protein
VAQLSLELKHWFLGLSLILNLACALQRLEYFGINKLLDRPVVCEVGELLEVSSELVDGQLQNAAVDLGDIGRLLDALLELDILVPEGMALEVKTDEMSTALEQSIGSACLAQEAKKRGCSRVILQVPQSARRDAIRPSVSDS